MIAPLRALNVNVKPLALTNCDSHSPVDFCTYQPIFAVFWMPHLLLRIIRHIDQSEPIEHPVDVSHAPDIAQSFGSLYYFIFYISQCQNYRTPSQTFTLLEDK